MRRFGIFAIMIVLLALPGTAATAASGARTAAGGDLCAVQAARAERASAIPTHLLHAIALAETGRWDEDRGASFAWPWTITSGGEGRYFPTKTAALAEVRRLQRQGVRNIDVGCMQINLLYHGDAFASLEDALDPAANVDYAAGFLTDLHDQTGDWTAAAARYHSSTPEYRDRYRAKVTRLWAAVRGRPSVADTTEVASAADDVEPDDEPLSQYEPAAIDHERTAMLNLRLREARAARRAAAGNAPHSRQLAMWRQALAGGTTPRNDVAIANRAIAAAEKRDRLRGETLSAATRRDADQRAGFRERRRAQLQAWRDLRPGG